MNWTETVVGIVAAGTIAGGIASLAVWYVRQSIEAALDKFELRLRSWLAHEHVTRQEFDLLAERQDQRFEGFKRQMEILRQAQRKG